MGATDEAVAESVARGGVVATDEAVAESVARGGVVATDEAVAESVALGGVVATDEAVTRPYFIPKIARSCGARRTRKWSTTHTTSIDAPRSGKRTPSTAAMTTAPRTMPAS